MDRFDYASRARLALRGPDRVRFLHGMVTCDVEKLGAGGGSRAAMLSVKGRLLAELTVYARPEELLLSMEGSLGDKVRQVLDKHADQGGTFPSPLTRQSRVSLPPPREGRAGLGAT